MARPKHSLPTVARDEIYVKPAAQKGTYYTNTRMFVILTSARVKSSCDKSLSVRRFDVLHHERNNQQSGDMCLPATPTSPRLSRS